MRFFSLAAVLAFLTLAPAYSQNTSAAQNSSSAPKPGNENLIVPGKSVGLLKPGMSAEEIRKVYGKANLVMTQIPIAEGATLDGAKLFPGTNRELELIWKDADPKKILSDVNVIGSAWVIDNGLKAGMTLLEVEKINGKPFKISGFDWDYGGYAVDFGDGAIKHVSLRFTYGEKQADESLMGDKSISSTDPKLRKLNPTVEKSIGIHMTPL